MKPSAASAPAASSLLAVVLIACAALTGCYDAVFIPKVTQPKLPELQAGTEIEVDTTTVKSRNYHFNRDGEWVRGRKRISQARYNGTELTFAQVSALGDPDWNKKLDHLRDMRATCRRGVVPQVIGYSAAIAMAVVGGLTSYTHTSGDPRSERETMAFNTAYGLGGLTVLSYGVGFLMGGHACRDAGTYRRQKLQLDSTYTLFDGAEVDMVQEMASRFNARGGRPVAQAEAAEAAEAAEVE